MKIDLVYLWVDGSDPKWIKKKNQALKAAGMEQISKQHAHRYHNNDELKYSLRSAQKFAPWINHIFIVTDNQVPDWLDTDNLKITVIDHRDIIPPELLPVFSANPLEYSIHKIKGLSEHLLYANDDMFFGREVTPGYFFTRKGRPIIDVISTKKKKIESLASNESDTDAYWGGILKAKNLVKSIYGDTHNYNWRPAHNIDPYRKSHIEKMAEHPLINDEIQKVLGRKFRSRKDLHRTVIHEWMLANNLAVFRSEGYLSKRLTKFIGSSFPLYTTNARSIEKMLIKPKLFCINNSGISSDVDEYNHDFLERQFPDKSEFEK